MGSQIDTPEVNVLVTGFGPFKTQFPLNPSWAIASSLPTHLPHLRTKAAPSSSAPRIPPVRIHVHPEPIKVCYTTVRALIPQLWDGPKEGRDDGQGRGSGEGEGEGEDGEARTAPPPPPPPKIDIALHIGMAGPDPEYQLEHRAHRDGYRMRDVDGEFLRDQERAAREGERWVWHGCPADIESDVDVDGVVRRWKDLSPDGLDLKVSEDPGRYLCDFIYYSSLAHLMKKGERRRVVFLHVPADASEAAIRTGTELAIQLIRALVESELKTRG